MIIAVSTVVCGVVCIASQCGLTAAWGALRLNGLGLMELEFRNSATIDRTVGEEGGLQEVKIDGTSRSVKIC